ncbi:MAG: S-methyl-5-thioribose-1-phosphate isomerase [Calditrichaeota bacterium]|nr:S-methyl-5-thioribose-1-phosphate isomerase [Calditrichota bacterium]
MVIQAQRWRNGALELLDQTQLPLKEEFLKMTDYREVADAIRNLKVRGAPAIGIAAAYGVCLAALEAIGEQKNDFFVRVEKASRILTATRPTAVNLFWALERMRNVLKQAANKPVAEICAILLQEAHAIAREDEEMCRQIGENGAALLKDGDVVLTHCNTGALATGGIGTALGVIYTAVQQGKKIHVFADETRPLLQGARLTAFELQQAKIDVTLICDNMAAFVMKRRKVNAIVVGADRIARNGDTANKIGTYNLAILAQFHRVPFYVVAPTSTIDLNIASGVEIPIEERNPEEVTYGFGRQTAPTGVAVYNPAFDITPAELIDGIITEKAVHRYPFQF